MTLKLKSYIRDSLRDPLNIGLSSNEQEIVQ